MRSITEYRKPSKCLFVTAIISILGLIAILTLSVYYSHLDRDIVILSEVVKDGKISNFVDNGVYELTADPEVSIPLIGSWTEKGDETVGEYRSDLFQSKGEVYIYVAGYPQFEKNKIYAEVYDEDSVLLECNLENPGLEWARWTIHLGDKEQQFRIIAIDGETNAGGWVGVSKPFKQSTFVEFVSTINPLLSALTSNIYLCLALLPGLFFSLLLVYKDIIKKKHALLISFLLSLAISWVVWWIYLLGNQYGRLVSIGIISISFLLIIYISVKKTSVLHTTIMEFYRDNAGMLNFVMLASVFYSIITYMYYVNDDVLWQSAYRYREMSTDNQIPFLFIDKLYYGKEIEPFMGEWMSSDRPPLFSAILLLIKPLSIMNDVHYYQFVGTAINCLCFAGIALLCSYLGFNQVAVKGTLFIGLISDYFIQNCTYLWPKTTMIAPFCIAYILLWEVIRTNKTSKKTITQSFLCGMGISICMLLHGGGVFSLIAFAIIILVTKPRITWNWSIIILSISIFYIPWMIYQKTIFPPGDRLLKWQLAGVRGINNLSFFETIKQAYNSLSIGEILMNKWKNITLLFTAPMNFSREGLLQYEYWCFFGCFGLLGFSVYYYCKENILRKVLFVSKYNERIHRFNQVFVVSLLVWCVLKFGPGDTVIHEGSPIAIAMYLIIISWGIYKSPIAYKTLQLLFHTLMFIYMFVTSNYSLNHSLVIPCIIISFLMFLSLSQLTFEDVDEDIMKRTIVIQS